jgi:cytochrome c553
MVNNHFPTIFVALASFAVALAGPANAADEIEAKLQSCNACHGQNGEPISPNIPIIWGQQTAFLVKQLHDYRAGDRENPIMSALAKTLKQEELRPAAVYLASKSWPAGHPAAAPAAAPNGIAVCQICHQEKFVGGLPAPRLAGQSYQYLLDQMNRFANEERTNSPDMTKIMQGLSAQDREAMARYIAGL